MKPDELLLIGKITGAHGIKGEVRVYPYVDEQTHLRPGKEVLVEPPGQKASPYKLKKARVYKKMVRVGFETVEDRSQAEALAGSRLFLPRSELPPAEPYTWYWCDLIGLDVYDTEKGFIGRVETMIETGSNDVFVVKDQEGERLVPAIEDVVLNIDLEAGKILVEMPEGL